MQLLRTYQIIETSERHLESIPQTNLDRLEIASYFAQIASVSFFSEMEEKLWDTVKDRLVHGGDEKLAHFLSKIKDSDVARMKRREISDTVALFGEQCKIDFKEKFPANELDIYSNVIKERHYASHSSGSDVTLSEVKQALEIGERILVSVKEVIA